VVASLVVEVRIVKAVLWGALALILAAALAWLALLLTWHVRITGAIRTLDDDGWTRETPGASDTLKAAGCRAIPYILNAIDPERPQSWICQQLYESVLDAAGGGPPNSQTVRLLEECCVDPDKSVEYRRRSRDRLMEWWRSDGHRFHQWWRVWTSRCGS
jgi:hypothetical protein